MTTTIALKVTREVETDDPDEAQEEWVKKFEAEGWTVAVEVDDVDEDDTDEEDDEDDSEPNADVE